MQMITLEEEFDKFTKKIDNGENFAFMRNADGELAFMQGRHVSAQEGNWKSPDYVTELGKAIYQSLSLTNDNVYYAISCPCCDRPAYYWYISRIGNPKNATFANLWINKNYERFQKWFPTIKRDAVLIANFRAENHKIGNLNILKHYSISDDCVSFWENEAADMIDRIIKEYGNKKNLLYVVSAGPMSGPIIAALYKNNPENCYVDFGSSIDKYYRGYISRPYMNKNNVYAKRNCWMFDPAKTSFDVTCVCNLYKRPESLVKQVEELKKQTLKPRSIILYQDGINKPYYSINLSGDFSNQFEVYEKANENNGVWERFRLAKMKSNTPYVCVFDDDTIPGTSWLENCHFNMMEQEGIYGTNGIFLTNDHLYPQKGCFRVGWHAPVGKRTEVDFVGHSWFFPRKCLDFMFDNTDYYQSMKYVAEDMTISFKSKEHGIKTYVPPHPVSDKTLWGSIPSYGVEFGNEIGALSLSMNNLNSMQKAILAYKEGGWKPLCMENKGKMNFAKKQIRLERRLAFLKKIKRFVKRRLIGKK